MLEATVELVSVTVIDPSITVGFVADATVDACGEIVIDPSMVSGATPDVTAWIAWIARITSFITDGFSVCAIEYSSVGAMTRSLTMSGSCDEQIVVAAFGVKDIELSIIAGSVFVAIA